jgi:hypothetical protein
VGTCETGVWAVAGKLACTLSGAGSPRCTESSTRLIALQHLASAQTLGRIAGVISTAESTVENISMPLAGMLIAVSSRRLRISQRPGEAY